MKIINDEEKYTRSKSGVFLILYGGLPYGLKTRLGVDEESAQKAYDRFMNKYHGIKIGKNIINNNAVKYKKRLWNPPVCDWWYSYRCDVSSENPHFYHQFDSKLMIIRIFVKCGFKCGIGYLHHSAE